MPQKGCVITWDFDILKGDVTFTLMRCRRHTSVTLPVHEHHVSGAVGGIGSVQYVDRHWTVGVDISIVEPPLVCHDGDSIQVSQVLSTCVNVVQAALHIVDYQPLSYKFNSLVITNKF